MRMGVCENGIDVGQRVTLDEGTHGLCDSCGVEINTNRLEALPWASLCLNCQDRLEGR